MVDGRKNIVLFLCGGYKKNLALFTQIIEICTLPFGSSTEKQGVGVGLNLNALTNFIFCLDLYKKQSNLGT